MDDESKLFELWFRAPGRGHKWQKVGRAGTRAEALILARGSGDYRIVEVSSGTGEPTESAQPALASSPAVPGRLF